MVSEKLLHSRARILLLFLNVISFTGSGIMISRRNYLAAAVFMISGFIFIYLVKRIYDSTNEAITFFLILFATMIQLFVFLQQLKTNP